MEHVAIEHGRAAVRIVERQVVDAAAIEQIHRETLQPVGQFDRDRIAFDAADLLEIGELRHLHAVAPDLPAEAPGAERRAFPVVLHEADVVARGIDADGALVLDTAAGMMHLVSGSLTDPADVWRGAPA